MKNTQMLELILGLISSTIFLILMIFLYIYLQRKTVKNFCQDVENSESQDGDEKQIEDLVTFHGGEDLTVSEILDAPGEVIGKSNYGTLYKALMQRSSSVRLLRFLRPICTGNVEEFADFIRVLGFVRHQNLVPLLGFYAGPRGEKLLVHPFYWCGNLARFLKDGNGESHKWVVISNISMGIAKGLDHLHTGLQKPLVHGNLKSKNVLLDRNCEPYISDFGLHLLLNPTAGQELLEASAAQGYKAPELIKMKDVNEGTDIYSFGIILLEMLTGKEPINENPTPDEDFYLPNFMRNAVLGHRITELFQPGIYLGSNDNGSVTEERILKFFQLAMACCSPSPSLRPNSKQVILKLEEIGR